MIAETVALHRIFEEDTLKKALTEFFEAQAEIEKTASTELMGGDYPRLDLARKHACYAKAYEEAMNRLRAYVQKV